MFMSYRQRQIAVPVSDRTASLMMRAIFGLIMLVTAMPVYAQTDLHITGAQAGFPIAVPRMCDQAGKIEVAKGIPAVIGGNLQATGLFSVLNQDSYVETPGKCDNPAFSDWSIIGAEGLVKGRIAGLDNEGRMEIELFLYDVQRQTAVVGKRYRAREDEMRMVAHRFSNEIIKFFTGSSGVFGSRIAFIGQVGRFKELFTVELDGTGLKQVTRDRGLVVSPSWDENARTLLYTSYRSRQPELYSTSASGGQPKRLTNRDGLEMSAVYVPGSNSNEILASIGLGGIMKLARMDSRGRVISQLTRGSSIDVSPSYSPDGSMVAFCSNRSGGPQIYVMDRNGGGARRISFNSSNYCTSPEWSPTDNRIIYVCRQGGNQLYMTNLDAGKGTQLTFAGNNEDPSWSPDGQFVTFASDFARNRVKNIAVMTLATGTTRQVTFSQVDNSQPSWSRVME